MNEKILSRCKEYLRFNYDETDIDRDLVPYIDAAIEYLNNAGAKYEDTELYYRAVTMIVTQWYENRLDDNKGGMGAPLIGLRGIISQLAYKKR